MRGAPFRLALLLLGLTFVGAFSTGLAVGAGAHPAVVLSSSSATIAPTSEAITPPSIPQDFQAHPEDKAVNLTWDAPASNGGANLTGYVIEFTPLGTGSGSFDVGPTNHTWVAGLENGVLYTFDLAARNRAGTGPNATAQALPGWVPAAPGNLTVVPGNESASFRWTTPPAVPGYPILSYALNLTLAGKVTIYVFSTPSATVQDLVNGLPYRATVRAQDFFGLSPESGGTTFTPYGPPAAPGGVTATYDGVRGAVVVSWTPPGWTGGATVENFTIRWVASNGTTGTAQVGPTTDSWSLTHAVLGVRYVVSVSATSRGGQGTPATVSYTVPPYGPPLTADSPLLVLTELLLMIGFVFVILLVAGKGGRQPPEREVAAPRAHDYHAPPAGNAPPTFEEVQPGPPPPGWGPPPGGPYS